MKSLDLLIKLHRFQMEEKQRMVEQIDALIADTEAKAEALAEEVNAERQRSGIDDVSHFVFPTYAKAAHKRYENLVATSRDLREQAADSRMELSDAYAQVQKFEALQVARENATRRQLARRGQAMDDEAAGLSASNYDDDQVYDNLDSRDASLTSTG